MQSFPNCEDGTFIRLSPILIIFPVSIFILIRNYDPEKASVMKFEKMVFMQDWDEVIRQHEKLQLMQILLSSIIIIWHCLRKDSCAAECFLAARVMDPCHLH